MVNFRFSEYQLRELRESIGLKQAIVPFDQTLSTVGTAEDLINIGDFPQPSENILPYNGLGASDRIGWVTDGNVFGTTNQPKPSFSYNPNSPRVGTRVFRVNFLVDDEAWESGIRTTLNVSSGVTYMASAYIRSSNPANMVALGFGYDNEVTNITGFQLATSAWTRINGSFTVPNNINEIDFYVSVTEEFEEDDVDIDIDAIQVEPAWRITTGFHQPDFYPKPRLTEFINPSTDRFSRWAGEENESPLIREPYMDEINRLVITSIDEDIYIDFDRDASSNGIFLPANSTFRLNTIIKERISFVNASTGGTPQVRGYVIGI